MLPMFTSKLPNEGIKVAHASKSFELWHFGFVLSRSLSGNQAALYKLQQFLEACTYICYLSRPSGPLYNDTHLVRCTGRTKVVNNLENSYILVSCDLYLSLSI